MLELATRNAPSLQELLIGGGDLRLALDGEGRNKYGCWSAPQRGVMAFGSSTASTISEVAFAACADLQRQFAQHDQARACARQEQRIRRELVELCELDGFLGLQVLLNASGTDAHRIASQILRRMHGDLCVIMPQESETGSGVKPALGDETITVQCRLEDGNPRAELQVDMEVELLTAHAISAGRHVLIVVADVSKTGLITPSPTCALALKRRYPGEVDILIDACQFRLSNANLRHYLASGCMLALTGSKFVTGPAFSGALLLPNGADEHPPSPVNPGMLLRWRAALTELRAFRALPEDRVTAFLSDFATTIEHAVACSPAFEPLVSHPLQRPHPGWDSVATIFPFLVCHPKSGKLLGNEQTAQLYRSLAAHGILFGQPVSYRQDVSALRLSVDMRLIVDALCGRGQQAVIEDALTVLDKTAFLAARLFRPTSLAYVAGSRPAMTRKPASSTV